MAHQHGLSAIDQIAYQSQLRTWNTKGKLCLVLGGILIIITANSFFVSLGTLLFMGVLTILAGRIKRQEYLRMLRIPALFIVTGALTILIQYGNGIDALVRYALGAQYLYITQSSMIQALQLIAKAFGAVSCLYMLALSTPMGDIIGTLQELHIPAVLIELMHAMYHYIFVLFEINRKQKEASASRLGYRDYPTSVRTFGKEIANLFLVSLKKANECYDAMQSRKTTESSLFWHETYPLTKAQLLWSGLYGLLAVILLAL